VPATLASRNARPASSGFAWEYLATQNANASPTYSYVAPTAADSINGHNPYTVFMVEAHAAASGAFWSSAPDSGYSVDNLAPATPAPFLGSYAAGTTTMSWGPNGESDLAGYRLYRGTGVGFTIGPGNLVTPLTSTAYADPAGEPYIYKLTAVDVHGNESAPATLVPAGALAVGDDAPATLAFVLDGANPTRSGASLRFELPARADVRVTILDAQGRRIRSLVDAAYAPGRYTARWDGADASGARVADGLYFARLSAGARELNLKIVLAR
jgi:hypothetical protein